MTRLFDQGCQLMQGFLFSPAVPGDDFPSMLKASTSQSHWRIDFGPRARNKSPSGGPRQVPTSIPTASTSARSNPKSSDRQGRAHNSNQRRATKNNLPSNRIRRIERCAGRIGLSVATVKRASVAAAAGAAAPPTSSGTKVPTTAVLATPARNRAKALFRSTAPALLRSSGDDSKAAQLRQPLLSRHRLARDVFFFPHTK